MESSQTRQGPAWLYWAYLHELWAKPNHCCKNIHCKTKTYSPAVLNINMSTSSLWNGGWGTVFSVSLLLFTENSHWQNLCTAGVLPFVFSDLRWKSVRPSKWQFRRTAATQLLFFFRWTTFIKYQTIMNNPIMKPRWLLVLSNQQFKSQRYWR